MNFFKLFSFIFLFFFTYSFSQNAIMHRVNAGESIYFISKKYGVLQSEILKWNPKLKDGVLRQNTIVKILNKTEKTKQSKANIANNSKSESYVGVFQSTNNEGSYKDNTFHVVQKNETLYSISKKYGITVNQLCEWNGGLTPTNLKAGKTLQIEDTKIEVSQNSDLKSENSIEKVDSKTSLVLPVVADDALYLVLPKETLFGIAKKKGLSVSLLTELNPGVEKGVNAYQYLRIKKSYQAENGTPTDAEKKSTVASIEFESSLEKANFLIAKASEYFGTRYKHGGVSPAGFDCSGLMLFAYKYIGIDLPRSSYEMALIGNAVDKKEAQKGDLIFFATFGGSRISHVGMITEVLNDEIKFIHSSSSSGVTVSSTKERYYSKSFVQINRILL